MHRPNLAALLVTCTLTAALLGCGSSSSGQVGDGGLADGGLGDGGLTDGGLGDGGGADGGATCGDGVVTAPETCDDGNSTSGDGCSSTCQVEDGWTCPGAPQACRRTVCGDRVLEGKEGCDDGNTSPFDGCSADCRRELDCTRGICVGFCGDGIVSPGEECDDANNVSGDGCSADCKLERLPGLFCAPIQQALPESVSVPAVFRDFRGIDETTVPGVARCPSGLGPFDTLLTTGCAHPDFEAYGGPGPTLNLVSGALEADSSRPNVLMPVFNTATGGRHAPHDSAYTDVQITSADSFGQWYRNVPGVNRSVVSSLTLHNVPGTGTYSIDQSFNAGGFFPLDAVPSPAACPVGQNCSWGISPATVGTPGAHDFGFTTETRYQFTWQGGEQLTFTGDDDVWVFMNGRLAVDLGGLHAESSKTIKLDDAVGSSLGLVKGQIYEIALFHAERHRNQSNFTLTLGGFVKNTTVCRSVCGDGIKAPDEECDLGSNNGKSMGCSATCKIEIPRAQ